MRHRLQQQGIGEAGGAVKGVGNVDAGLGAGGAGGCRAAVWRVVGRALPGQAVAQRRFLAGMLLRVGSVERLGLADGLFERWREHGFDGRHVVADTGAAEDLADLQRREPDRAVIGRLGGRGGARERQRQDRQQGDDGNQGLDRHEAPSAAADGVIWTRAAERQLKAAAVSNSERWPALGAPKCPRTTTPGPCRRGSRGKRRRAWSS